jgi:subtilisin family serine protease
VRPNGDTLGLAKLQASERAALRKRFGGFMPGFDDYLATLGAWEKTKVAIYFSPEIDWADLEHRLASKDPLTQSAARNELRSVTARDVQKLAGELEGLGLEITQRGQSMPAIFAQGTRSTIERLRHHPQIRLVMSGEQRMPQARGHETPACTPSKTTRSTSSTNCSVDPNIFHKIDTVVNHDRGYYGAGQRVAIYDDANDDPWVYPGPCGLYEDHEAFEFLYTPCSGCSKVQYSNFPECQARHGTEVAGVISASVDGNKCGAAEVEFYYPNDDELVQLPNDEFAYVSFCAPGLTLRQYEWMQAIGDVAEPNDPPISVVNESWGCIANGLNCSLSLGAEYEGITQDYYSRYYGMTVVKAAGNSDCDNVAACPWTLNSICVGAAEPNGSMASWSSWGNPMFANIAQDHEEPDLVALGSGSVCTAQELHMTKWAGVAGTSFSAPLVTSLIALFRGACGANYSQGWLPSLFFRALMRHAATAADPEGPAYSTPRPDRDYQDGGGLIDAESLFAWCDGTGVNGEITGGSVDLAEDNGPMPSGDSDYQNSWEPPGETQSIGILSTPQAFDYDAGNSDRRWRVLKELEDLGTYERIRATLTWDACPFSDAGEAPANVPVDFDLFLHSPTHQRYVWASQSMDDNNEGLDYTVQPGEEGDFWLIVTWPEYSQSCACAGGSCQHGEEPIFWVWQRLW